MPTLTFIRHAESELNRENRVAGSTDCNVTPEGSEAAKKALPEDEKNFDAIYRSPLKRTAQTLEALIPGATAIVDNRLTEMNFGEWEGRIVDTIDPNELNLFRQGKFTPRGGETAQHLEARLCDFIDDMFRTYRGNEKILVVTHGGVIRAIKQIFGFLDSCGISDNLGTLTITDADYERYKNR
ncbi:MAG: histidine phosphatase family protein [Christensenellales bacterium]